MVNKKKTPSPQGSPEKLSMPIITPDNVDVLPSFEQVKAQVDQECEPLLEKLLLLIVCKTLGNQQGYSYTLHQQSDFNTPWGNRPQSEEEEIHQDLVWIHKVLPPNDKFNPAKAKEGFYKVLKVQFLNEFWEKHEPKREDWRNYARRDKNQKQRKIQVTPPTRRCRGQTNA